MMLQQDEPDDYVIATGEAHSVREFVEEAFRFVGKEIVWKGVGLDEVGVEKDSEIVRVTVDSKFYRPTEVVCFHFLWTLKILIICLGQWEYLLPKM